MKRLLSGLLALMLLTAGLALAEGDFSETFADRFLAEGEAPVLTETSYQSQNIAIEITSQRYGKSDVYVADVYVRSVDLFQRYFVGGNWNKGTDKVPNIAAESGGILAMTGDSSQRRSSGWVMGNGNVANDGASGQMNTVRDICIVYKNGEMRALTSPSKEENLQVGEETDDIWHIFLFGPALLDENGKAFTAFDTATSQEVASKNPRSVLGYYEPGHYCFVQVDGRETKSALENGTNRGLSLPDLAELMESLGCKAAYNLDGGRSSMLWFNGELVSTPANVGRKIGDIMIITEVE